MSQEIKHQKQRSWNAYLTTMTDPDEKRAKAFNACKTGDLSYFWGSRSPLSYISDTNEKGHSLLMLSAYNGHEQMTSYLLSLGADPSFTDPSGNSILMGVAFKGNVTIAKLLLQCGANVNYRNPRGQSALDYALLFGRKEMAGFLSSFAKTKSIDSNRFILWTRFVLSILKSFFYKK